MSLRLTDADLAEILRRQGKPVEFKYRANPKPREGPSESQMQQAVIERWDDTCGSEYKMPAHLLMAFPLQAARSPQNGARMKREGMRKGTPDLLLAAPRTGTAGLWIEMKRPGGVVSPEQTAMLCDLKRVGYSVCVCYSEDEAWTKITEYLRTS